jgi:hypothetical protein
VSDDTPDPVEAKTSRPASLLRETSWDVAVGLLWAALIVAIVLFSGVATQFAYVDF